MRTDEHGTNRKVAIFIDPRWVAKALLAVGKLAEEDAGDCALQEPNGNIAKLPDYSI